MTKAFIQEMEATLHKEETRLRDEITELKEEDPKNSSNSMTSASLGDDETDAAAEATAHEDQKILEESLEAQLRDVEGALERISKGTYGTCKYCDKEIAEARLRARPESSSCVECKKARTLEA
jgi:DnaK suppressor protein